MDTDSAAGAEVRQQIADTGNRQTGTALANHGDTKHTAQRRDADMGSRAGEWSMSETGHPLLPGACFQIGDFVRKVRGSCWCGRVVGWYSTALTPEGYAVESSSERGSVQIYPASALMLDTGPNV